MRLIGDLNQGRNFTVGRHGKNGASNPILDRQRVESGEVWVMDYTLDEEVSFDIPERMRSHEEPESKAADGESAGLPLP